VAYLDPELFNTHIPLIRFVRPHLPLYFTIQPSSTMLSRLPALSWASQALSRPLSTFQPLRATARPDSASGASKTTTAEPGAIDPVPAKGPDAAPHVKPGDIVAGAQAGPPTERLSAGVITAETTSGAPGK
jgi:hypothetical protein